MRILSALGTPNITLQASVSVASPGDKTAQSYIHIYSHPIGPLCGEMSALDVFKIRSPDILFLFAASRHLLGLDYHMVYCSRSLILISQTN